MTTQEFIATSMNVIWKKALFVTFLSLLVLISTDISRAQRTIRGTENGSISASPSRYCLARIDIGKLDFGVTNFGLIGIGQSRGSIQTDCFTGAITPLCDYPKGANTTYLFKGAIWVGGVVGNDTLVSTGADYASQSREFHPITEMEKLSSVDPELVGLTEPVSELDYIAVFVDTFTRGVPNPSFDPIANRAHKPLGIQVTQRTYGWSYEHTDDFVLFDYEIKNISDHIIKDAYIGIYWDADVHKGGRNPGLQPPEPGQKGITGGADDLGGFLFAAKSPFGRCESIDTLNMAWIADNDGDPVNGEFEVDGIEGILFLNKIKPNLNFGFNWWVYNRNSAYDYGPQQRQNFRFMGNGAGMPFGDRNKYALLSNGEIDFDQAYIHSIGSANQTWTPASPIISGPISRGADVQHLISIGPFQLIPGASVLVPMGFIAAEQFHKNPSNFRSYLYNRYRPDSYYDNIDFSNIIKNAITAKRVYDVPGFDSNDDDFAGNYILCSAESSFVGGQWVIGRADTNYISGDGVPDWLAASPPPRPEVTVSAIRNGFKIRFNGMESETTPDIFSNLIDFEGYRIYIARDDRETSYSLLASYDLENYDKYTFTGQKRDEPPRYQLLDKPFSLEELRCLYGNPLDSCNDMTFDPLRYSYHNPLVHPNFPESLFFFVAHDYNQSELGIETPIRKRFPLATKPVSLTNPADSELTEDGKFKYYEYEFEVTDLLPNVPYWITVTTFDFGSPESGLQPLESSKVFNAQPAYPDNEMDEQPDDVGNVYIFPNPYRNDSNYRSLGLEGRGEEDRTRNRVRKITFANLPPKCTIRIFSLDGDLIREIDHDVIEADPTSSYHEWDMVTRNMQMIVSGLYYWVVEDEQGNSSIGKLVVLM